MHEPKNYVNTINLAKKSEIRFNLPKSKINFLRIINKRSHNFNSKKKQVTINTPIKLNLNNIKLIGSTISNSTNKKSNILINSKKLPIIPKICLTNYESSFDKVNIFSKTPQSYRNNQLNFNSRINNLESILNNKNENTFNAEAQNSDRNLYNNKIINVLKSNKFGNLKKSLDAGKKKNYEEVIKNCRKIIKNDIVLNKPKIPDQTIDFTYINKINKSRPQTSYGNINIRRKNLQSAKNKNIYNMFNNK